MNREQEGQERLEEPARGAPHAAGPQTEAPQAPWRRPRLERLRVSLDTANSPGSGADGGIKATVLF